MHLILLAVLAQTAPPLVRADDVPTGPRVERHDGKICVIEPLPQGGEEQHCRDDAHEYSGAPQPVAVASGAPLQPEKVEHPSQFGFTMALGGAFRLTDDASGTGSSNSGFAYHGRLGVRYALLSREEKPDRPNVSFSLLAGGDLDGSRIGAGVEGRLEGGVGGNNQLYQPVFSLFLSGGVQYLGTANPEFHVGAGANLDLLCTGVLGHGFWLPPTYGSPTVLGAILLVLSPSLEYRYVVRADGTHYNALMLSMGM